MFLSTCWLPAGFFISGCNIVSVESPLASTLNVKWSSYSGATVYLLDLRVVNSTTTTPVVVMTTAPSTGRLVQGLQPGRHYRITMKVFQYTTIVCTDFMEAMTGKKKKQTLKKHTQKEWKGAWLKRVSSAPHSARHISDHFIQSYFQYLHKFRVV